MSTQSIDDYRLTSMEEPTDEMLSQIMREAAEEAQQKEKTAMRKYFDEIRRAAALL